MSETIEDTTYLQPSYHPNQFVNRTEEQEAVATACSPDGPTMKNLLLHGPRGTGKTHLMQKYLEAQPSKTNVCYVLCEKYRTQYQVLLKIIEGVTGEAVGPGHHTADLQRKVEKQTGVVPTVIVLDEVDFLLLNDGNDLLYFLSRLDADDEVSVVLVSGRRDEISSLLDERTGSSLQPQRVGFEPYSAEQLYRILTERARKALQHESVRREAVTYISTSTQNALFGLLWLKEAARSADSVIDGEIVKESYSAAVQSYVSTRLASLSDHHRLLYRVVRQLTEEGKWTQTGEVYDEYRHLCEDIDLDELCQRRISDYLKHLELLDLLSVEYYYGGEKGKTREFQIRYPL